MSHLKWLTAYQVIMKESVLFIHKVIFNNQSLSIWDLITFSLNSSQNYRSSKKTFVNDDDHSKKVKKIPNIYSHIFI